MADYMNVFMPYAQGRPIENNLSRILAIILKENPFVFERFISLLNDKILANKDTCMISKPNSRDDSEVVIQKNTTKLAQLFSGVSRIIPVTLTPDEAIQEEQYSGDSEYTPDIAVKCGNDYRADLIIIEVKRDSSYAEGQVKRQAASLLNAYREKEEAENEDVKIADVVHLKWVEIVHLLQTARAILSDGGNFILTHYLDYIREYFPQWLPVKPFTAGMCDNDSITERMKLLAKNCAGLFSTDPIKENYVTWRIPVSLGYASDVIISPSLHDEKFSSLNIELYLGYTKKQDMYLLYSETNRGNMSWVMGKNFTVDGVRAELTTEQYIRFSCPYPGRVNLWDCYLKQNALGTDKNKIRELFFDSFYLGQHCDLEELESRLSGLNEAGLLYDSENWRGSFEENVKNSGYSYVNASLVYYVFIYVPADDLEKCDKDSKLMKYSSDDVMSDKPAALIFDIIQEFRRMVETEQ